MTKLALAGIFFVVGAVAMLVVVTNDMDDATFDAWLSQEDS